MPTSALRAPGAGHSRNDFSIALDSQQRSEGGNSARKFFRAVDGIDDQSRSSCRFRCRVSVATAHLFAEYIQRHAAGGNSRARHGLNRSVRFSQCGSIQLPCDAHPHGAKISHRHRIGLIGNGFQQRSVLFSVAHRLPRSFEITCHSCIEPQISSLRAAYNSRLALRYLTL